MLSGMPSTLGTIVQKSISYFFQSTVRYPGIVKDQFLRGVLGFYSFQSPFFVSSERIPVFYSTVSGSWFLTERRVRKT